MLAQNATLQWLTPYRPSGVLAEDAHHWRALCALPIRGEDNPEVVVRSLILAQEKWGVPPGREAPMRRRFLK